MSGGEKGVIPGDERARDRALGLYGSAATAGCYRPAAARHPSLPAHAARLTTRTSRYTQ